MTDSGKTSSSFKSLSWSRATLIAILFFSSFYTILSKWDNDSWKNVEGSDGTGYYSYLPATYIYHDFTFHFIDTLSQKYPQLSIANNCGFCNLFGGKGVNKYFSGESVLLTPFFLVAHLASGSEKHPADGYSYFYMLAISLAAVFYMIVGLWSIQKLLGRFGIKDGIIAIVLICIFLGTNLYYYTIWAPEMSHVYSFGLISLFFLLLHKQIGQFQVRRLIFLSVLLALLILVRPINVIVAFALPFFAGNSIALKTFFRELVSNWKTLFVCLLLFSAILFIQPLYYHLQCGSWFVYAYSKEGFDFLHPNFFKCLFSYSNGFYIYAPILAIATFGMFTFIPKNYFQFTSFLMLFCAIVWVISSWWAWTYGAAFGMRPLVEYISLFALLLGLLLNKISVRRFIVPVVSVLLLLPLIALCQLQIWQYRNGIIGENMTKENYWMVFLETRDQFLYINSISSPDPLPEHSNLIYEKTIDFETSDSSYDNRSVISGKAFSGNHSVCLKEENNHSPFIKIRMGDYFSDSICRSGKLWVNAESKWMLEDNGSEARLNVVVSNNGKYKLFMHQYVIHQLREENKWGNCILNVKLPPLDPNDTLSVYPERNVWFPVYVDDLKMKIYSER